MTDLNCVHTYAFGEHTCALSTSSPNLQDLSKGSSPPRAHRLMADQDLAPIPVLESAAWEAQSSLLAYKWPYCRGNLFFPSCYLIPFLKVVKSFDPLLFVFLCTSLGDGFSHACIFLPLTLFCYHCFLLFHLYNSRFFSWDLPLMKHF